MTAGIAAPFPGLAIAATAAIAERFRGRLIAVAAQRLVGGVFSPVVAMLAIIGGGRICTGVAAGDSPG